MNGFVRTAIKALTFALFALVSAGTTWAAAPIKAELHALAAQPRAGAPEWIEVRLTSSSAQLLEGVLELTVLDDGSASVRYRTQELALTTGQRNYRLLLPTSVFPGHTLDREVRARFLAKDGGVWDLGKFPLHTRILMGHGLVLGVGHTGLHTGEASTKLWQSLRLERFAPDKTTTMDAPTTSPVILEPDDFPADPLVYCAFDAVLFEPGAYAVLKEKPREALGQWLAVGGSVCVVAAEPLDPVHVETLRTWLRADPAVKMPEFDVEGRAQATEEGLIIARVGQGRLVVVTRPIEDFDTPAWRRATAFLWKLRSEQADAIERDGKWHKPETDTQQTWQNSSRDLRNQLAAELTEKLLPKTVRVIPLPVILTILIGFIVAVGPLDYFVLGKLRARKFTWVLFPLLSVGFTVLTMKLAEHYLGTNTHRGAFVLTDLGSDGRVLREMRCELVLPAKPQEFTRDTQHAFAMPLGGSAYVNDNSDRLHGVVVEGQYPAHYTLRFPLAQWTPQLIRVTSFGEGADESGINWSAFDPAQFEHRTPAELAQAMTSDGGCTFTFFNNFGSHIDAPGPIDTGLLERLTITPDDRSLFVLPSPGGNGPLDDLAVLERHDTRHLAVIVTRRKGPEIHSWRRVYPLP